MRGKNLKVYAMEIDSMIKLTLCVSWLFAWHLLLYHRKITSDCLRLLYYRTSLDFDI